ncbi:hypothetical protein TNCV_4845141 [Trichonephila clavipes]|uniref:Uncharacterized protein n=1 Tax=Trichonephila clavipes TaxID=2585209 RepID=A0A8X6WJ78_TRICX|nr:hypothetical protein TNCV_4845141 [Trichonephila clavipes]
MSPVFHYGFCQNQFPSLLEIALSTGIGKGTTFVMARFKIPVEVFTLTTLTRPSLPGNTSRIRPIGQSRGLVLGSFKKNELILHQVRVQFTPFSTGLQMDQIFGAPTVPKFISQGLKEFPPGMIGQRIRSSIRFRKG